MKITVTSDGEFEETIKWLEIVSTKVPSQAMREVGRKCLNALSAATPVGETGETARSWEEKIEGDVSGSELIIYNNAHPEADVNIARLIDQGYATGNGGYVPPRPYIRQAVKPILDSAGDMIIKELIE